MIDVKKFFEFITYMLICVVVASVTVYGSQKYAEGQPPKVNADGAILMDFKTGRVLWKKNSDKKLAMASTTKIMTAIVAIENGNLNDIVEVSKKAETTPPVKMHLKKGEKIKLEYLLYALMLQSSNDAAVAIAEHIGGDVETFCKKMTEKAKELGAKDTLFVTPNGLDSGEHHSTAYDMAVITRYALNNDTFNRIINTKNISFKSDKSTYDVINKNRLLSEYEGANGVKTGFTGKAGHCFVGAAKRADMQLISVVLASGWGNMGKQQKWVDTKRILDYGFSDFYYFNAVNSFDNAGSICVQHSKKTSLPVIFKDDVTICIKKDEEEKIRIEKNISKNFEAPIDKNQKLGTAKVYIGDELVGKTDIIAGGSAERHDFYTVVKKILESWIRPKVIY